MRRHAGRRWPHDRPRRAGAVHPVTGGHPRHLAEKILAGRAALEGERKQVTILFADIVGSTELIRDRDPEEAQALLDGAVTRMMDAVHRYEGTVSRLLGDGLMALFGAPIAHEDHALRACFAALALQEAVRAYAEETQRTHGVVIQARVGLNSGEVVVRVLSDDLHMDYTALGQTVHLAARLEQVAEPGGVRLSADTLRLVEGYVEARSLGAVPIKGLVGPVEVYDLLGAGAARTRLEAAASRGLTPFVGRRAERDAIDAAMVRAREGHGQIVALVGEPGVGKSRLVREVVNSSAAEGWAALETVAVSYGTTTPYLPTVGLLRSWCGATPSDDPTTVGQKLAARLRALDPALEAVRSPLFALLDAPVDEAEWREPDPGQRRRRMLDAVTHLLLRVSQERPLLLVVEDLHWIDTETQAMLDGLVDSLPAARVLLLVNYRPEYVHAWGNKGHFTQLRLDPLGQLGADDLLAALLGQDAGLADLKLLLIERTGGNPFFLEEAVRSLVEVGLLVGERGAYRATGPADAVRVPAKVQAVLAARIDRLPPEDKRLIQTASVVGTHVPYAVLAAIADLPDDRVRAGLGRLQAAELLCEAAFLSEPEYAFQHALTHEVAYGGLLQERRRELHARIVAAVEALHAGRLDEHVERLAQHALRGQVWDKAVAYSREAGARAMARSAVREGIAAFDQAMAAVEHLPEGRARTEQAIDLRFDLRTAYWSVGEHQRAHDALRQAEALAVAAGDSHRLGWVSNYLAHHLRASVDHREGVQMGERAIAIAAGLGDLPLRVSAVDVTASSYHELGRLPRAIELIEAAIPLLEGDLAHKLWGQHTAPAVSSRAVLAWCYAWQGAFPEAIARAEEALRLADEIEHPHTTIDACQGGGLVYVIQGNVERAIQWLDRALAIRAGIGQRFAGLAAIAFAAPAYVMAGRTDEAIAFEEQALLGRPAHDEPYQAASWVGAASLSLSRW